MKDRAYYSPVLICDFCNTELVHIVFLLELFYAAAAIYKFLLTGKERMALRANIKTNFVLGGLCHKCVATSACYLAVLVLGMDT